MADLGRVKSDARDNLGDKKNSLIPRKVGEEEFDNIIPEVAQYGRIQFWDDRYLNEPEPFEWFHPYEYYRDSILDAIDLESKVLIAGCGTSNMPEDMAMDGYKNVIAQDISRVAIKMQQTRCQHIPEISYMTGNMTDMDLEEETMDAVIDKGLLDALLCSSMGETVVAQYVNEVIRILSPTGTFICISSLTPEECLPLLEQFDIDEPFYTPWLIEVQGTLKPKMFENEVMNPDDPDHLYWIYIAQKKELMVHNKKIKENKLKKKKAKKGKKATIKAPNL